MSRGQAIKYYSSDNYSNSRKRFSCLIDEKTEYRNFFNDNEMIFYKNVNDLSEKLKFLMIKKRRSIAKNGKDKYMRYFNSNLVAEYIINKSLDINQKRNFLGKLDVFNNNSNI